MNPATNRGGVIVDIPRVNRFTLFLFYLFMAIWSLFHPNGTMFLLEAHKEKHLRDAEERSRKRRFNIN